MRWSREQLDERVETLAEAHQGGEFVAAVARFADEELDEEARELLGAVLLERADEEHAFQELVRRRARERGWWHRTIRRLEDLVERPDVSGTAGLAAAAVERGDADELEAVSAELRADRGLAARVLDRLSRHPEPEVRRWVSTAARDVLDEGGVSIVVGLARDRDRVVRDRAIADLVALDPDAARRLAPSLRRRLRSSEPGDAESAMWTLAELGDRGALPRIRGLAERGPAEDRSRRSSAEVVCLLLEDRPEEVLERMRAHEHDLMPWLARAARVLGTEEARAVLAERAEGAPDAECRAICRAELEKLADGGRASRG